MVALVRLNAAGRPQLGSTPSRSFNFETEFEIWPHGATVVGHRDSDSESRVAATLSSPPHYM